MARNITITFNDGSNHVYQNVPDDVSPDTVQTRAETEFGKQVTALNGVGNATPPPPPPPQLLPIQPTKKKLSFTDIYPERKPVTAQNALDFTVGATSLMRGGANLAGGLFGQDKLGEKIWPSANATDSGYKMAGQFADPLSLLIGKGVATALPYKQVLGGGGINALKAIGSNLFGGALTGGTIGGLSENGSALEGAALGGALAVSVPALIASGKYIGKTVGQIADLVAPGGAKNIADRYVNVIVDDANKGDLAQKLRHAKILTKGSNPTVADAVANTHAGSPLIAHQKIVAQEPGGPSALFGQRYAEQKAAREAALSFAGTEDEIQKLVIERSKQVAPLYDAVRKSTAPVDTTPVTARVKQLLAENPNNEAIAIPLSKISKALSLSKTPQPLKSLSDNISNMLSKTVDGKPEFDAKVLSEIKNLLDDQIGLAEPAYSTALKTFSTMSAPINARNIGQTLKEKLLNPSGAETPGMYLRAISDENKLLKASIGFGKKGIDAYLSPIQQNRVNNVAADLERSLAAKNPLQPTNLRGGVNIANESTVALPRVLSTPVAISNYLLKSLGRNVEPEIDSYLARLYLNPKELASILKVTDPASRSKLNEFVQTYGKAAAVNFTEQQQ